MNIFEISQKIQELSERDDLDPQIMHDTIESLQLTLDEKVDNLADWRDKCEAESEWLAKRIKQLQASKKATDNRKKWITEYLTQALLAANHKHYRTDKHIFSVRNYKASTIVDDAQALPVDYVNKKTEWVPDKAKIYKALKAGKEIPGAHLKENQGTVIK